VVVVEISELQPQAKQVAQVAVVVINHQMKALVVLLVHQVKVLQEAQPLLLTAVAVEALVQQAVLQLQALAVLAEMVGQHQ
jgi:hypothetical protein